jgi:hypothetical protein
MIAMLFTVPALNHDRHASSCSQIDGPPEFLDPESTRRLSGQATLARSGLAAAAAGEGGAKGAGAVGGRMKPGPGFDISVLAPKLKGHKR